MGTDKVKADYKKCSWCGAPATDAMVLETGVVIEADMSGYCAWCTGFETPDEALQHLLDDAITTADIAADVAFANRFVRMKLLLHRAVRAAHEAGMEEAVHICHSERVKLLAAAKDARDKPNEYRGGSEAECRTAARGAEMCADAIEMVQRRKRLS